MGMDVSTLDRAESTEVRVNGEVVRKIWHAKAHGVYLSYRTEDLTAEYWVASILTMRQKGVALVDSSGQMVKNERSDL